MLSPSQVPGIAQGARPDARCWCENLREWRARALPFFGPFSLQTFPFTHFSPTSHLHQPTYLTRAQGDEHMSKQGYRVRRPTEDKAIRNVSPPTLSSSQRFRVVHKSTGRTITTCTMDKLLAKQQEVSRSGISWHDTVRVVPVK